MAQVKIIKKTAAGDLSTTSETADSIQVLSVGVGVAAPVSGVKVSGTVDTAGFKLTTSPTAGYLLTSDAGGVATWQAPPAGMAIGLTITGATQGSVLFAGASGILAQDNANLFWNSSSNHLLATRFVSGSNTVDPADIARFVGNEAVTAHAHYGFIDHPTVNYATSGVFGHASFAAYPEVTGTTNSDHQHSFQDEQTFSGTGTLTRSVGFYTNLHHNSAGTITEAYGFRTIAPSGSGVIGTRYGVHLDGDNSRAGTNWALYSAGAAKSRVGGSFGVGIDPAHQLHVLKSQNAPTFAMVENLTAGTSSYAASGSQSDAAYGALLAMSSTYSATSSPYLPSRTILDAQTGAGLSLSAWNAGGTADMRFYTGGYPGVERMRLDASGNLGLGTPSPGYPVHVVSSASFPLVVESTATGAHSLLVQTSHSGAYSIVESYHIESGNYVDAAQRAYGSAAAGTSFGTSDANAIVWTGSSNISGSMLMKIGTLSNHPLVIGTNDVERVRIDTAGRMMIGQTSVGTDNGQRFAVRREAATSNGNTIGYLAQFSRIASDTAAWYMGVDTDVNAVLAANNADIRIGTDTGGTFTEHMRVASSSGNVGLGVSNPIFGKLQVAGSIAVAASSSASMSVMSYLAAPLAEALVVSGRGTLSSPAAIQTGDLLGRYCYVGQYDGTVNHANYGVQLDANATENWSSGNGGSSFSIKTVANGSPPGALTTRFHITGVGDVGMGTSAPVAKLEVVANSTATSGTAYGILSTVTASPSGSAPSFQAQGQMSGAILTGSNSIDALQGGYQYTTHNGTGTVVAQIGVRGDATCGVPSGTATTTTVSSGRFTSAMFGAGTWSVGSLRTVEIRVPAVSAGTLTGTNVVGLYLEDFSAPGGTWTNKWSIYSAGGTNYFGGDVQANARILGKSAAVTAANDLTLGAANQQVVGGSTQINAITTTGWTAGSQVTLIFSGAPLVKHNTAGGGSTAVMLLASSLDFQTATNSVLRLEYDGTSWHEISRKVA